MPHGFSPDPVIFLSQCLVRHFPVAHFPWHLVQLLCLRTYTAHVVSVSSLLEYDAKSSVFRRQNSRSSALQTTIRYTALTQSIFFATEWDYFLIIHRVEREHTRNSRLSVYVLPCTSYLSMHKWKATFNLAHLYVVYRGNYIRQRCYVFAFVCLSVCPRMTQKVVDKFPQNVQ